MSLRYVFLFVGIVATTATCSSTTEPRPLPTVLVTNAMCDSGHCATLEVRAFLWKFDVPQPPSGLRVLGEAHQGRTCLTFPPSWTLHIIGPDTTGRVDTVTITWTPSDTVPIYLIAVDSAVFHRAAGTSAMSHASVSTVDSATPQDSPYDGLVPGSVGETGNFLPGDATGWSVSFPSAPLWSARVDTADVCRQ
jgi:hypothetical protein